MLRANVLHAALVLAAASLTLANSARAAVLYDEGISGDAPSGSSSVPLGVLPAGSNLILGGIPDFDTDDYAFTIAPGFLLNAINIDVLVADVGGSAGLADPVTYMGISAILPANVGSDFLDLAGIAQPLGPGNYLLRTTTGTGGPVTYQFDFQVSGAAEVPEASTVAAVAGLGLIVGLRVLRRQTGTPATQAA